MDGYTLQIEASDDSESVWQAVAPTQSLTSSQGESATDIANWAAANQTLATGSYWRVRVWRGMTADTSTRPDAEVYADELQP